MFKKPQEYRLVEEHEDHYELEHPETGLFKVAKEGLAPEFHEKMQRLYAGTEEVKQDPQYDEDKAKADIQAAFTGEKPKSPEHLTRLKSGNYVDNRTRQVVQKPTVGYAYGTEEVQPEEPIIQDPSSQNPFLPDFGALLKAGKEFIAGPNARPVDQQVMQTGQAAPVLPQQPVAPQPQEIEGPKALSPEQQQALLQQPTPQQEQIQSPAQQTQDAYKTSIDKEQAAVTEKGNIEAQKQEEQRKQYESQIHSLETLQQASQKRQKELHDQSIQLQTAIANNEVDPNRLWNNSSTASKVSASIGLILGGIGGGMTGRGNQAAEFITNMINRDIEAQKENSQNKRSLYQLNLQQAGSDREADLLTQRQLLDTTQAQLAKAAAQASGKDAKQNAVLLSQALEQKKIENDKQIAALTQQAQLINKPFHKSAIGVLTPEQQAKTVILPDGQTAALAPSPEAAKEARQKIAEFAPIERDLKRLDEIKSAVLPGTKEYGEAKKLVSGLVLKLKEQSKLGRLSPEGDKLIRQQFEDPTKIMDALHNTGTTKLLMDSLRKERDDVLGGLLPGFSSPDQVPGARKKR